MAAQENFTAINAILEKDILPRIVFQGYDKALGWRIFNGFTPTNDGSLDYGFNTKVPVGSMNVKMDNNILYFPIITGNTGGVGAVGTSNQVKKGSVPMLQGSVNLVTQTAAFDITEQLLETPGTVRDPFSLSMEQSANSLANDINRQVYSDGTATIGTTNASATSATNTLVLAASTNGDIDYAQYIPVNSIIQIGTNNPVTITGVTGLNTVTFDGPGQTWSAGVSVYNCDASGAVAAEFVGLNAITGTGAYAGITNSLWKGNVTTSLGSFATYGNAAMNKSFFAANKTGKVKVIVMNQTVFNSYGNSQVSKQQFQYQDPLYGGWATLQYMGGNATVLLDYDCPDDTIHGLTVDDLYYSPLKEMNWLPGERGTLRGIPGTLNYEAIASMMGSIWAIRRNSQFKITGTQA
jgi:hypothetical protein